MLIIQQEDWIGIHVCTAEGNISNNDSKVKELLLKEDTVQYGI